MSQISTHILDLNRGTPAADVEISLSLMEGDDWRELGRNRTDSNGRNADLLTSEDTLPAGTYRLHFATGQYYERFCIPVFFPYAEVVFNISDRVEHYHIPLLLSAYGYSTYRGS